jgi:hypothetical protein
MYDCPGVHQLSEKERQALVDSPACNLETQEQLCTPSRFSGAFMQCIEHAHAIVCDAWWRLRF